MPDDDHLAA